MQHTKPESKEYASKQNYKKKKTHTHEKPTSLLFSPARRLGNPAKRKKKNKC